MREYNKGIFRKKARLFSLLIVFTCSISVFLSIAHAQKLVKPEWVMPDHYPEYFHGWGRIGYIDSKEIVINDIAFRLSPYIEYHSPDTLRDSVYLFKVGKLAGFLFDEAGEIDSLWLIDME